MRTEQVKIYKFEELSDEAKEKAIEEFRGTNLDSDWWDFIYEDARNVDLKITGFDTGRGNRINIEFYGLAKDTAESILREHGDDTETYKLAKEFIKTNNFLQNTIEVYTELLEETELGYEQERYAENLKFHDDKMGSLSDEFLKDLGEECLSILKDEAEYLQSDEAIIETIEANEYEFLQDGERY
jgi:hypothetical protein